MPNAVSMTPNPFQGLKQVEKRIRVAFFGVSMTPNPFQGLKPFRRVFLTPVWVSMTPNPFQGLKH